VKYLVITTGDTVDSGTSCATSQYMERDGGPLPSVRHEGMVDGPVTLDVQCGSFLAGARSLAVVPDRRRPNRLACLGIICFVFT